MVNFGKAALAGFVGTAAMTMLMFMAPFMGMPKMDIGGMLAGFIGFSIIMGWVMHFIMGIVLTFIYAFVAGTKSTWLRGMLFSFAPWVMMMVVLLPMMGAGFFGGSIMFAMGALLGHLVWGSIVGAMYNPA